jgi:hypothetical protein
MNDPYSMDVLNLYLALKSSQEIGQESLVHEVQRITKNTTEITPNVFIVKFEKLLEKAGGLKFMEISDIRPKPA